MIGTVPPFGPGKLYVVQPAEVAGFIAGIVLPIESLHPVIVFPEVEAVMEFPLGSVNCVAQQT